MTARGKVIVFEGPDGVGKTTLCREVARALQEYGIQSEIVHLPGSRPGTFGKFVYDIHHQASQFVADDLDPTSLQVLHASAHINTLAQQIVPALNAGRWVLLDRFWWSTIVYGRLNGVSEQTLKILRELAQLHWCVAVPAVVFLVSRPGAGETTLTQAYESLNESLRDKYPRRRLLNNRPLDEMVSEILTDPAVDWGANRSQKSTSNRPATTAVTRDVPQLWIAPDPVKPTPVFDSYWRFAAERQQVLFRRQQGDGPPWTDDPVIRKHRFTNAYRASDRVSQYLISEVIYDNESWTVKDLLFRIILFKLFNKIETWELLENKLGPLVASDFSPRHCSRVLNDAKSNGIAIYSGAYIMASAKSAFGHDLKHDNHLDLLQQMLDEDLPTKVEEAPTLSALFQMLVGYPSLGPFLAYQYAIDINYSLLTNFDEMSFVVPGPGARDGIAKCFSSLGGLNEAEIIRWTTDRQDIEFERLGLEFTQLGNRPLQLIDCQNLFCEVDKYARVMHPEFVGLSGRTRIKQTFAPRSESKPLWFPPKWDINQFFDTMPAVTGESYGSLFESHGKRNLAGSSAGDK